MLLLHAAALAEALSTTCCPAVTLAGSLIAPIGLSAAVTAADAFAMPAPQVSVWGALVQMHSTSCESSFGPLG